MAPAMAPMPSPSREEPRAGPTLHAALPRLPTLTSQPLVVSQVVVTVTSKPWFSR